MKNLLRHRICPHLLRCAHRALLDILPGVCLRRASVMVTRNWPDMTLLLLTPLKLGLRRSRVISKTRQHSGKARRGRRGEKVRRNDRGSCGWSKKCRRVAGAVPGAGGGNF